MSITVRVLAVVAVVSLCTAGSLAASAKDNPKETADGKVCSSQCGAKHGSPSAKDKKAKYDKEAYEGCMIKCMERRRG